MPKTADYPLYCPIARALDVLGDRWTLLIMRELTGGDRRFTDLRTNLPGIPPNLLSQRLKALIDDGLVATKELPPPAARTVYTCTPDGRATVPVLRALARFGAPRLAPADESTPLRPAMVVSSSITAFYDPMAAVGLDELYELIVDGESIVVPSAAGGSARPSDSTPDLVVETQGWVLVDLRIGSLAIADALRDGLLVRARGSAAAFKHFREVFRLT